MPSSDLIGKGLRNEIREYFVGTTIRQIGLAFEEAGIRADLTFSPGIGGERRTYVEQFYHTMDWSSPADAGRFLLVLESVLEDLRATIGLSPNQDGAAQRLDKLQRLSSRDGITEIGGRLVIPRGVAGIADVRASSTPLDSPDLQKQLERLRSAADDDPALAIGTAKELVETSCRAILEERGAAVDSEWDITRLVKEVREVLTLLPEQVPEQTKGIQVIRRLLGQLGAVAQSLGELRNLYGTGHGRRSSTKGIAARHAKLAIGSAATLVTFLLETHWDRERPK